MLDFRARGFGFIPARKTERELSLAEQLIERLEERLRKHQASLRLITVSGLAMALSACKDDALVQGSDGNDVLGNTPEHQIFRGRLGNDVYSYLLAGTDRITDTGGTDELRVSVVDAEGVSIQTSFKRVGDDLVVTQSGEGNSVTVEGAFCGGTALEAVTLVYEDGNRPDQAFDLIPTTGESPDGNTNMFVGTEAADTISSAQSGWFFGAGGNDTITIESGSNTIHGGNGDDVITLGDGDDKVFAGAGNDTIHAGLGANEVMHRLAMTLYWLLVEMIRLSVVQEMIFLQVERALMSLSSTCPMMARIRSRTLTLMKTQCHLLGLAIRGRKSLWLML
jgi:hypothetical protein